MSKNLIEVISTNGLAKVILQKTEYGATAWYYRYRGTETWLLDRTTEMKLPFPAAVSAATKIVDAPPRIGRR